MEQVNPKGVPSDKRKGRQMLFVKEDRHPSGLDRDAEEGSCQEDKEPGEEREIVGGNDSLPDDAEGEKPAV